MKKLFAIIISGLIINLLCFFYYNPLHGSDLNSYRLEPNTMGVNLVEGFGIMYADENGFSNKREPLIKENYILVMGSSYSKADQVPVDYRYSGLLNSYLGYEKELGVYNLAYNGGKFDDIVKNFQELITEFPNSEAIIIEVTDSQLKFDENDYFNAMNQIQIENSVTGEKLSEHDTMGKARLAIKKYCPLLLLYVNQYTQWKNSLQEQSNSIEGTETEKEDADLKYQYFANMVELLRQEYEKEIIIVYHNGFSLDENNKMNTDLSETGKNFLLACQENGMTVLDMSQVFSKHFDETREIPYGFWNTSMGTGHLNKIGHHLIAQEIYCYLKGN